MEAPLATTTATTPCPRSITLACRLLWLALTVSLFSLLPAIRGTWWVAPDSQVSETFALGFGLCYVGIQAAAYAILIVTISHGRNWARWVLFAWLLAGWYSTFANFQVVAAEAPLACLWDSLTMFLEASASFLLFFGPGTGWFKRRRQ